MSHYFENDENLDSKKRILELYIQDKKISFISDKGVFSSHQIDYGSFAFLKVLLQEDKVDSLLDVGCGYGVLGITLKLFKQCNCVDLLDINPRAVRLCKENIDSYQLSNVNCFVSDGFKEVKKVYNSIVFNPPIRAGKETIYKIFEDSKQFLKEKGAFYIVIKKNLGAPSAIQKLQEIYSFVEVMKKDKGYYIIKSFN